MLAPICFASFSCPSTRNKEREFPRTNRVEGAQVPTVAHKWQAHADTKAQLAHTCLELGRVLLDC